MCEKAKLCGDKESYLKILNTDNPRDQKKLGRKVKGFNQELWDKNCMDIVIKGNLAKFRQNSSFRDKLLDTSDREIVESSKLDRIWGIGYSPEEAPFSDRKKWGKNLLGKCLMVVRDELRKEL
jgi:ribA/ribD-fused uncharacterized protein